MKTAQIFKEKKLVLSAEVFPPKENGNLEIAVRALKDIAKCNPDFVSITCGAGGRGGMTTADVATVAKDALDLECVAHLTCVNATRAFVDAQLETLKRKGIDNVLVLRGDVTPGDTFADFRYASDLAAYIKKTAPDFNLIGACYPEGHYQAESFEKDVENLKRKIDAGVEHLITQLFLDNEAFYRFRDRLSACGIHTPVQAGIMPITATSAIKRTVELSGASMPHRFTALAARFEGEAMKAAGLNYAIEQITELISNGVAGIHLYTMNKGDVAQRVFSGICEIAGAVNAGGADDAPPAETGTTAGCTR